MATEETRAARADRLTQQIDDAIERLAGQLAQGFTEEYKRLLSFWSRFHRYSPGNVVLILSQRPDATAVAGYHAWKRAGRQVAKGSRAIAIWCPILRSIEDEETGLPAELCVGFVPCGVFADKDLVDIATNPLPTLWRPLPDDADGLYRYLCAQIAAAGYRVEEAHLPLGRQGSSSPDGRILVSAGLDSRNRIMVLLHELAHQLEHFKPDRSGVTREWRELEAESAAAVVCALVGIEHPTARDYILSYRGSAEDLKHALSVVQRLVGQMVTLLGLRQQRDQGARVTPLAAD